MWCTYGVVVGLIAHYCARFSAWRKGNTISRFSIVWQVGLVALLFVGVGYSQTLRPFHQIELINNNEVLLSYPLAKPVKIQVEGGYVDPQRGVKCILVLNDGVNVFRSDMINKDQCLNVLSAMQQRMPGF